MNLIIELLLGIVWSVLAFLIKLAVIYYSIGLLILFLMQPIGQFIAAVILLVVLVLIFRPRTSSSETHPE